MLKKVSKGLFEKGKTYVATVPKRKKMLWGTLLTVSVVATSILFALVVVQGNIEDNRDTTNYNYEVGAYYVSNEIHMLFSVNTLAEWDEAVRNTVMDNATRNTVYGTSFESFRFPDVKALTVTDLLYSLGDKNKIDYYAKVETDKGSYRIMITVTGKYITEFKVY